MSARLVVCAVAVAVGVGVPPVAAAPTGTIETSGVPEVPKLAGGLTLWTQGSPGGSLALWSGAPEGDPNRVQHFPFDPIGTTGEFVSDLAASPSLAMLTLHALDSVGNRGLQVTSSEHYAGPAGAPPERIARCGGGDIRSIDASGEAYVYHVCDDAYGHVEVRDEAAEPASPPRSVGAGGVGVRIAKRFVAWLDEVYARYTDPQAPIVVYDRVADAEVYRVPAGFGGIQNLDVQEDGKVVIAFDPPGTDGYVVGWASPEEPSIHRLPLPPRDLYDVRIDGDRIAFQTGDRSWIRAADVGTADLAGNVRWLAHGTDALVFGESFDYDGERIVWRELGCEERHLVIADADGPERIVPEARDCPLRLLGRPQVRRGVAAFRFGCGAFEPPCEFDVSLHLPDGKRAGRASQRTNPVRVKLSEVARRRLSRRGTVRVRARVLLMESRGPRYQVRRKTIRLRAW